MTTSEKYRKVLELKKLKISKAEQILDFGRNTLDIPIKENRLLSQRLHNEFMTKFHVNPTWWETGKGEVFEENGTDVQGKHLKVEKGGGGRIPFYDAIAVGGASVMLHEQDAVTDRPSEMIDPGTFLRAATGALRVYGHSMYPKYPAGCIVAFKASSKRIPDVIVWGEDYVVELEDRRIIKKIDKGENKDSIKAVSLNGTNGDKMKYQFDTIDIPLKAVKRMYMVLGKIELEASI